MNGSSDAAPAGDAGEAVTNAKQVLNGAGPATAGGAGVGGVGGTASTEASAPPSGGLESAAPGAAPAATATAAGAGDGDGTRARSPRPSPRPKKRQRPSLTAAATTATSVHTTVKNSDDEDEADDNEQDETSAAKDAFYLRHQNKALASELRAYKRQIDLLVAERDHRRDRCDEAREGVDKLAEIWAEVEGCVKTALVGLELVSHFRSCQVLLFGCFHTMQYIYLSTDMHVRTTSSNTPLPILLLP